MSPLVVDASAILAIVLAEPEGEAVAAILRSEKRSGTSLLAPAGMWVEVVNSLIRRHRRSSEAVLEALRLIDAQPIQIVHLEQPVLLLTLDLTERHGLTSYDAAYLAVAFSERGRLLTLDEDLALAAGERAVAVGGTRLHESPAPYEHEVTWPRYKEASAYVSRLRAEALAGR